MSPYPRTPRRRLGAVLLGLVAVGLLGAGVPAGAGAVSRWNAAAGEVAAWDPPGPIGPPASPPATGAPSPVAPAPSPVAPASASPTPPQLRYDQSDGPVLGSTGPIRRFRVALESTIDKVDLATFAARVDAVLGDPRSWIAGGTLRLQRVAPGEPYDFTIYLVTASTSTQMCQAGGVPNTNNYTSCRTSGRVILNLDRWLSSVPSYRAAHTPLSVYQAYMINHETGHELGHQHELCPSAGQPAPVMQQQTLGLHGCTANPWPYLDGKSYDGPLGTY